jgi:aminoglycoside phosphotransferase (APT) family kinase protein
MPERRYPLIALRAAEVEALVALAIPDARVVEMNLVATGKCNTNYRIKVHGHADPVLLRVVARSADVAATEVALLQAVGPVLEVPEVLYADVDAEGASHPFYMTRWIEAELLASRSKWSPELGAQLGRSLARIHGFGFPEAGQLTPELKVVPWDFGGEPGTEGDFVASCMDNPHVRRRLGDELWEELGSLLSKQDDLHSEAWFPPCLVHGDFNPTNLLVRGDDVAGVLDWEWAHAGDPLSDFGNLLRDRGGPVSPEFESAVAMGWQEETGVMLPDDWRARVRLRDLSSGLEFLTSEADRPASQATALANIERTVTQWDSFQAPPRSGAWTRVGAVLGKAAVGAGRAVADAARAIDPDLRRHFAQVPLMAFSYLTAGAKDVIAQEPDGNNVVVFVHGLGGRRGNFMAMATWFHLQGRRRRYAVGMGDLGSIPEKAERLGEFLQEIARVNGLEPGAIDIVAHSLGGVVTRVALEDPAVRSLIAKVVTLGSPHAGTHTARYLATDVVKALRPNSETIAETLRNQTPWPPAQGWPQLTCLWSDADMLIVPAEGATVDGANNILLEGVTHLGFLLESRAFRATLTALS